MNLVLVSVNLFLRLLSLGGQNLAFIISSATKKGGRGRNYSLVRRIASSLPEWLIPEPQISLPLAIPHVRSRDSLDDSMMVTVTFEGELSDDELQEEFENSEVSSISKDVETPVRMNQKPDECLSFLSLPPDVVRDAHSRGRTPSPVRREKEAMARISELEEQLSSLRSQIAQIVAKQEGISVFQVQRAPPPPPPPPPPPAPPLPPSMTSSADAVSLIRERREKRKRADGSSAAPARQLRSQGRPDMREVLRDIGNVKLKPVARGPDGTPLRVSPLKQPLPNDPAAIVALALRHRFAKTRPMIADSPPQDLNESGWSEDESTPSMSPFIGRHLLRKVRGPNLPTRIRQSWGEEMGASTSEENL